MPAKGSPDENNSRKSGIAAGRIPEMEQTGGQDEYLTVDRTQRDTQKSTIILVGLFCVGMFCLWYMIKQAGPEPASAGEAGNEQVKIETAIARITGVKSQMDNSMDEILDKFYRFSDMQQVDVNELVKNPFQREMLFGIGDNLLNRENLDVDPEELERRRLREKAGKMELLSIMESAKGGCCMIEDKILYEGDSIDEFLVKRIKKNSVVLETGEIDIELRLTE